MIQDINDEALRDDPVKTATFVAKRQQNAAVDNKDTGGEKSNQQGGGNQ